MLDLMFGRGGGGGGRAGPPVQSIVGGGLTDVHDGRFDFSDRLLRSSAAAGTADGFDSVPSHPCLRVRLKRSA